MKRLILGLILLTLGASAQIIEPDHLNLERIESSDNRATTFRKINDNALKINNHDHKTGRGLSINVDAINVDKNFPFNEYGVLDSTFLNLNVASDTSGIPNESIFLSSEGLQYKNSLGSVVGVGASVSSEQIATAIADYLVANPIAQRTPSELKTAYESNPDTNAFTDAEKQNFQD